MSKSSFVGGYGICALVLTCSFGASARWINIGETESSNVFVNPATVIRAGDMVKIWSMHNLKKPEFVQPGKSYSSYLKRTQFDCLDQRSRPVAMSIFTDLDGKGELLLSNDDPQPWTSVVPDSSDGLQMQMACGMAKP